jgi:hypothetical protein
METEKMVVGLPKFFPLKESVKDVCLAIIIKHLLTLEKHGEHKTF